VTTLRKRREVLAVFAQVLAVVLLLGGLPMFEGVIVTVSAGSPTFTLNICHPLPGLNQGAGFSAVPLASGAPVLERPAQHGVVGTPPAPAAILAIECPDTPPPKPLV
jgi:hypothetical protein